MLYGFYVFLFFCGVACNQKPTQHIDVKTLDDFLVEFHFPDKKITAELSLKYRLPEDTVRQLLIDYSKYEYSIVDATIEDIKASQDLPQDFSDRIL